MLFYGKTDVGKRRAVNQDNFAIRKYAGDVLLAVVCDGVGGANGGDTASAVAVDIFREQLDLGEAEHPSFFGMAGEDIFDVLSMIGSILAALQVPRRKVKEPKPYPRPGQKPKDQQHFGRGALPPDKLREWFNEKRRKHHGHD